MNSERDTLISEPDDGVYFAMNKGLQIAQGHLVVFMNAGDRFATSETLASVRGAYKADLDVVHGDVKFDTPRAGVVLRRSRGVSRRVFASHQAVYIRRTTHLCHQFDTSYKFAADYAVFAKLHTMGYSFCYLPMPLSITIVDASSLSVKNRPAMAWEDFQINLKIIKWNWFAALSAYILSITKIVIVKMLLAFPDAAMRLLPKKFGNRLY